MKISKYLLGGLIAMLVLTAFAPVAVPSKPSLVSPINKLVKSIDVATETVELKWGKSAPSPSTSPIASYDIEVSESSAVNVDGSFQGVPVYSANEPAPVPITSTNTHLIPAGTFDFGKLYYWHVRAVDDGAVNSAWSATGVFRVGVQPPTLVALAPPPATDLLTLRPTFHWTPGAQNANSYTIQISTDSGFSSYRTAKILSTAALPDEYTPTADLAPKTPFYWRVRADNSSLGTSAWSATESFTTANPPSIPVLVSPKSTQDSPTPLLTWKSVSKPAGETFATYQVEIFDTSAVSTATPVFTANDTVNDAVAPAASLADQNTTKYKVPVSAALLPTQTYYWRIKAFNGDGEYSTSSVFTFFTTIVGEIDALSMDPGETLGNVPGLEGPLGVTAKTILGFTGTVAENANLLSLRPIFKWNPGALSAETFTLQVASAAAGGCDVVNPEDSDFNPSIINISLPFSESEYQANLDKYPGLTLCWRIRGNHSLYGSSDYSDVQIFKTASPPSIPVPSAPVSGTLTNDNSPRLVWKKSVMPSGVPFGKYEVEISYTGKFSGYDYPADTIPPFLDPIDPASYPLPSPILPDNIVLDPIYPVVPPEPLFPKYPMVDQAHDPITDLANTINEPWYDVEPETVPGPPEGTSFYGAHAYYWRVRAYNEYGEYSAWSTVRSVKITVDRPTGLVLTDCAVPATVITDALTPRPCFDWDDVYKAGRYTINIVRVNTNGTTTKVHSASFLSSKGSQYQPTTDLPKEKNLRWSVSAASFLGYGTSLATTSSQDFLSANPPPTPAILKPKLNSLELTTTPEFTWRNVIPSPGTNFNYYEVEIAEDANFAFPVEPAAQTAAGDEFDTSYTIVTALDPARKYYWHVRACNDEVPVECSAWSPASYFRTSVGVTTLVPADTATNPLKPIFEWDAVSAATSYTIWVSRNPACISPVISATTSALIYQSTKSLSPATPYYWCVRANNSAYGPGAWSAIDTFATP